MLHVCVTEHTRLHMQYLHSTCIKPTLVCALESLEFGTCETVHTEMTRHKLMTQRCQWVPQVHRNVWLMTQGVPQVHSDVLLVTYRCQWVQQVHSVVLTLHVDDPLPENIRLGSHSNDHPCGCILCIHTHVASLEYVVVPDVSENVYAMQNSALQLRYRKTATAL